jgi:hypothetical protein
MREATVSDVLFDAIDLAIFSNDLALSKFGSPRHRDLNRARLLPLSIETADMHYSKTEFGGVSRFVCDGGFLKLK